MKLTQQLPIALSLACAVMLSSCSKEEMQTPQPEVGAVNEHSGLKTDAGEAVVLPYFAPTVGVVGLEMPGDWSKTQPGSQILAGSSTLTNLWGNPLTPWIKPLPGIPTNVSANSMITTSSFTGIASNVAGFSRAKTVIRNLKPGKTYALTFYVATTTVAESIGSSYSYRAKSAEISIYPYKQGGSVKASIDLMDKEGQWVKKTITFTPDISTANFVFSGLAPEGVGHSFTHLFVDRNSIKELTPFQTQTVQ